MDLDVLDILLMFSGSSETAREDGAESVRAGEKVWYTTSHQQMHRLRKGWGKVN